MFKKFTFTVDNGVRQALRDEALDQALGYRSALRLVGEICLYAVFQEKYEPSSLITDQDDPPGGLYELMNPAHGHKRSALICQAFRLAFRIECVLCMFGPDEFALRVTLFKKRERREFAHLNFTIGLHEDHIVFGGGVF